MLRSRLFQPENLVAFHIHATVQLSSGEPVDRRPGPPRLARRDHPDAGPADPPGGRIGRHRRPGKRRRSVLGAQEQVHVDHGPQRDVAVDHFGEARAFERNN